jgi:hypothetical protein
MSEIGGICHLDTSEVIRMGIMDKAKDLKNKATGGGGEQADQVRDKVDDVAQKADEATGGKASGPIEKGADEAKEGLDTLGQ